MITIPWWLLLVAIPVGFVLWLVALCVVLSWCRAAALGDRQNEQSFAELMAAQYDRD